MTQQSTLRGLAKAYANGALEREKYRNDRTAYIEAVLSGAVSIKAVEHHTGRSKTGRIDEVTEQKPGKDRTAVNSDSTDITADPSPLQSRTGLIVGAAGVALLLILVLVFTVFTGNEDTPPQSQGPSAATSVVIDTPPTAAQTLIKSFLGKNTWSESSMNAFLTEWEVMPEPEKSSIKNTVELGQLTNEIYKKLLEERALSGIGNPETSYEKQRQLVQFAANLGITDPRISLPEQPVETVENL